MVKLKLWVKVQESEDPKKVKKAISNILPDLPIKEEENLFIINLDHQDLKFLRELIRVRKIGKTVLGQIIRHEKDNKSKLMFNKQAAFMGKTMLVDTYDLSPMGAIVLDIVNFGDTFVKWLTGYERNL